MSTLVAMRVFLFAGEALAASTLVMALAWLASYRNSASARHLAWTVGLAALILLPLLAALVPGQFVLSLPAPAMPVMQHLDIAALTPPSPEPASVELDTGTIALALIALWVAGIAFIALRSAVGAVVLRAMRRDSVDNPFDESELPELASGRHYELRVSNAERGPVTWGVFRPIVLLPHKALFWPGERLHAVLRHELAHIHRHDSLSRLVSLIACTLYWPNPFVWLGARAMRREAEMAADDAVIVSGVTPSEYAGELLEVAAEFRMRGLSPATPLFMAAPSALEERLKSVLHPTQQRSGVTSMDVLKIAAVALLATSALVAARPSLAQDEPSAPPSPPAMSDVPAAPPVPAAPAAPSAMMDVPALPAPPNVVVHADGPVRVIHIHDKTKGHREMRIIMDGDDTDATAMVTHSQAEMDHAMAQMKLSEEQMRAVEAERPRIEAEIRAAGPEVTKALADARKALAQVSDARIRARVDEALARVQARIDAAHMHMEQHRVIRIEHDDDTNDTPDTPVEK